MVGSHIDRRRRMTKEEVQVDDGVWIDETTSQQQPFNRDGQPRFFLAFADGTVFWRFARKALAARKLSIAWQGTIGAACPDQVATRMFDNGNADLPGK